MEKTITAQQNQSIPDIVHMAYGTLEALMPFCRANNISPTDIPVAGTVFVAPDVVDNMVVPVNAGVLKYIQRNKITIGTAAVGVEPPPPPPGEVSGMRVLLYPFVDSETGTAADGTLHIENIPTTIFENYHPLDSDWPISAEGYNVLKTQWVASFLSGGGMPGTPDSTDSFPATMSDINVYWEGMDVPSGSFVLMAWSALGTMPSTLTYRDVMGNEARVSPLLFIHSIPMPALMARVLPKIEVDLVGIIGDMATVRFKRYETPIPTMPAFSQAGIEWVTDVGYSPDPSDPTNDDKIIITVPVGVYRVGVIQSIKATASSILMPPALMEVAVEVY
jgi:hypothetical protein